MKTAIIPLLLAVSSTQAGEIQCPSRWSMQTGGIQQGTAATEARVLDAGVVVGPLALRGDLRGEDHETKTGYEVRFAGLNDYVEPLAKWAYCRYDVDARLFRRLPDNTGECVAMVRLKPAAATLRCR